MPIYPDVNGAATSYCSIRLMVGPGLPIVGVKSLNYKDVGEIPKVRGASPVAITRTRGKSDPEGDLEILQAEWDELLPKITQGGLVGYMETAWDVSVTYAEPSARERTKTDLLIGVKFFGAEKSNSEGTDASMVKLTMSIMQIRWNGLFQALRSSDLF